ncbi:methyltransferase domain-containing protein [Modestobacter sp. Leaf380]|uniref:methyltransferase domain-containing protein n=1 Tax=Modestobacter sp. Leaf380 TaxID=1736356 RepID=UPI0006FFDD77|nr:methyltransferase domain-containing protein [Modestobacter sp. Leaf380]KQS65856.1 hypothetical protein ASG41_14930 [Modestobacter sp. Leaf380]
MPLSPPATDFFLCPPESQHFAAGVDTLLRRHRDLLRWDAGGVLELGTGDAAAIAEVVAGLPDLRVRGIDISATSVARARENTAAAGVSDRYTVEHGDFFDLAGLGEPGAPRTVVSNPPYLPAPDGDLLMPELWGGPHGNDLVLRLLGALAPHLVIAMAGYADPVTTLATAEALGYRVLDVVPEVHELGVYSREPKVLARIQELCAAGRGWIGEDSYAVAVTLLTRQHGGAPDRREDLLAALRAV